ncbi:MAG TPA: nitroreductase [Saprospiraceae bacterium]|nr:nitroreductase [Saprospiraceae bacterium]
MPTATSVSEIIRRRRSVFPKHYVPGRPVERSLIEELLENANRAPTHKLTQPWRFRVFHSPESREHLARHMELFFQNNTPAEQFSEEKMKRSGDNPRRAAAVIALLLHPDPLAKLPEWEEVAALAMCVQNMWLTCTAYDLGCYWSSPKAALEGGAIFDLEEGERCMGLFYLGWHEAPSGLPPSTRTPVGDKTKWY